MRHTTRAVILSTTFCACYLLWSLSSGAQPKATKAISSLDTQKKTDDALDAYFKKSTSQRAYLMVDKPIYQSGETVWFRVDLRDTRGLTPTTRSRATVELISPKGYAIDAKRIDITDGVGENDFSLPLSLTGGQYRLRLKGTPYERPIIVASYEAPRLQKSLQFLRKSYSPGESVSASVQIKEQTGEPFASKKITALVTIEGKEIRREELTTDEAGVAAVSFALPKSLTKADGLLTILLSDGGNNESIQRRVPIVLNAVEVELFPEGGDLITGLNNRVYFSAHDSFGEPTDITGRLVDNTGKEVTKIESLRDGLGRFSFLLSAEKSYRLIIDKPTKQEITLPTAKKSGCVMQAIDDFKQENESLQLTVSCTSPQKVFIEALSRESRLASGSFQVDKELSALGLKLPSGTLGVVRVTLFNEKQVPLAERLLWHGKSGLTISLSPDKKSYQPREKVTLNITTNINGKPAAANLGLAVVDASVLSFADDKAANLVTQMLLIPDAAEPPIEAPNFYLSDDPKAPQALDLLLGTRGYRRFSWETVLDGATEAPSNPKETKAAEVKIPIKERPKAAPNDRDGDGIVDASDKCPDTPSIEENGCPGESNRVVVSASKIVILDAIYFENNSAKIMEKSKFILDEVAKVMSDNPQLKKVKLTGRSATGEKQPLTLSQKRAEAVAAYLIKMGVEAKRLEAVGIGTSDPLQPGKTAEYERAVTFSVEANDWDDNQPASPVRVFPSKEYAKKEVAGPRDDFRETIFWQAQVKTNAEGKGSVSFYTSDAITSFRATAEGFAANTPGHVEATFASTRPFRIEASLPKVASAGDLISVPVTLTNETDKPLSVSLSTTFGALLKQQNTTSKSVALNAKEAKTIFYELLVGQQGEAKLTFQAEAQGLQDSLQRTLKIGAAGFPLERSIAGTIDKSAAHELSLKDSIKGTAEVSVIFYPSPLAELEQSLEGLLQEPSGCFEQTSANNYPNVMVMKYLQETGRASPALVERTNQLLASGYKRLIGFEVNKKGFEWFGREPAHEALTAYAIVEFTEMRQVYPEVDAAMIQRSVDWLKERRDGKGGFLRSDKGLDSFGRASLETTNAYITWTLAEAGYSKEFGPELAALQQLSTSTKDTYQLALATNALFAQNPKSKEATAALKRLLAIQATDGSFPGGVESITRSGESGLLIETTSLAIIAMLRSPGAASLEKNLLQAASWLNQQRSGFGTWSNTQATILGLRASLAYHKFSASKIASGELSVSINGNPLPKVTYGPSKSNVAKISIPAEALADENKLTITHKGERAIPYSIALSYRTRTPPTTRAAPISIKTELSAKEVKWSEPVTLTANIQGPRSGAPMTIARIQIPGGLVFQSWQLKELVDKGQVDFYETNERELILYWESLPPEANKMITLSLLAKTPGSYTSQTSSAYLYYSEDVSWAEPLSIKIKP